MKCALPQAQWKGVFHGNGSGGYGGILALAYDGMEAGSTRLCVGDDRHGNGPGNAVQW